MEQRQKDLGGCREVLQVQLNIVLLCNTVTVLHNMMRQIHFAGVKVATLLQLTTRGSKTSW